MYLSVKLIKINDKSKRQERILVVTDKAIYNIKEGCLILYKYLKLFSFRWIPRKEKSFIKKDWWYNIKFSKYKICSSYR